MQLTQPRPPLPCLRLRVSQESSRAKASPQPGTTDGPDADFLPQQEPGQNHHGTLQQWVLHRQGCSSSPSTSSTDWETTLRTTCGPAKLLLSRGALQGAVLWSHRNSFTQQQVPSPTATRASYGNTQGFTLCSNELVFLLVPLWRKGEAGCKWKMCICLTRESLNASTSLITSAPPALLLISLCRWSCSPRGEKQHHQQGRDKGKSLWKGLLPHSNTPHARVMWE